LRGQSENKATQREKEDRGKKRLANEHTAQTLNYLVTTGLKLGFLVNFCAYPKAKIIRIVR
jgi:GxxExxY protein